MEKKIRKSNATPLILVLGLVVALAFILASFEYKDFYTRVTEITTDNNNIVKDGYILPPVVMEKEIENKQLTRTTAPQITTITDVFEIVNKNQPETPDLGDIGIPGEITCDDCDPVNGESIETPDDTTLHMVVQFMPTFKECKNIKDDGERQNCFNNKLFEFIGQNIHYPEMARTNNITGKVYIAFVVEKDGTISSVKVLRDIGGGCGDEAARVISLLPTMEPGRNNGRPQRVTYQIPINFELGNK